MKKSTASRYLLDLSRDKTRSGDPGFGLVTRETDPEGRARLLVTIGHRTVRRKLD